MTIRERMIQELEQLGMFRKGAEAVIEAAKQEPGLVAVKWGDDESCYPPELVVVLWVSVKRAALGWIRENQPEAWYRANFENESAAART